MAGPDVRAGEALLDPPAAEACGPREVRWAALATVQGPGPRVPAGAGAQTASPKAGRREDQAKNPEVRPAAEPSLAAPDLRERTALMRPEVFTLLRTGNIHFAFTPSR